MGILAQAILVSLLKHSLFYQLHGEYSIYILFDILHLPLLSLSSPNRVLHICLCQSELIKSLKKNIKFGQRDCFTVLWACASFLSNFLPVCGMIRCQTTYVAESSSWHQIVNIFRACYCSLAKENIPTTWAKYEQKFVIKETVQSSFYTKGLCSNHVSQN